MSIDENFPEAQESACCNDYECHHSDFLVRIGQVITQEELDEISREIFSFDILKGMSLRERLKPKNLTTAYNQYMRKTQYNRPRLYNLLISVGMPERVPKSSSSEQ